MITQGLRIALRTTRARSHPRLMSTAVPVIDFSGMEGGAADKAKVVQEVREAAENVGFLAVKGHGVPQATIDEVWSRTREFFDQPEELKARGTEMTDTYPYGYIPFGGETLSAGRDAELGDGGEEAMAPSDLNESFAVGPNRPVLEGPYKLPPLKWPSHDQAEEFKAAWLAYYGEMELLSARLLRCFALALELEENWFDDKITNHRSAMRALNYPDLPEAFRPSPGQMRASAHTDYGSLTILLQEDAPGGLQVRPVKAGDTSLGEEGWHPVPARPGHFGKCKQRLHFQSPESQSHSPHSPL